MINSDASSGITEADLMNVQRMLEKVDSFARLSYQIVYVVDVCKKEIQRAYGDFDRLCGISREDVMKCGYDLFVNNIPNEELLLISELNDKAMSFCDSMPEADRKRCTIFYDFHFVNGDRTRLVNHQATMLAERNGKPWIIMCTLSLSSHRSAGNLCVKMHEAQTLYKYNGRSCTWDKQEVPPLRELERSVIILSSQGLTMREIAEALYRTEDAIKACKRELFRRMGTSNMIQTVQFVMNYKLL